MAAPLIRTHYKQIISFIKGLHYPCGSPKYLHLSSCLQKIRSPDVCLSPDNSIIMCWHPESEHPYEHTLPLIRDKTEVENTDSVLKVQHLIDEKLKNRPDGPTVNELSELFCTTKHQFYRRKRHEKKTEMIKYNPKDREGF
ncbi:39S ribosomal protein L42, mitochondrial-like isoform X2 [Biomphalaria glabrata]|uniref:Large ribosomal subunit protein mL42 n=1 Tax=Biomphalaria glabrata TaxID=6526 RepID=A0A9W3A202_BIOGL|nr:39S ribosomal protein L42, mitochondrial-like isoform X2 [Biomphalaria glabrata]